VAGGCHAAVGEMAAETGVRVDLEKVPLNNSGLSLLQRSGFPSLRKDGAGSATGEL